MIKLFVSGFPLKMEEIEIVKLFIPYGEVRTIKLVRNKQTKICKGYGFIEMPDALAAEKAASGLNGLTIGERQLTVTIKSDDAIVVNPKSRSIKEINTSVRAKRPRRAV